MGGEPATSGHDPDETERIEALLAEWAEICESGEFGDIEFHDLASLRTAIADEIQRVALEVVHRDSTIDRRSLFQGFPTLVDQLELLRNENRFFGSYLTPVHPGETVRSMLERLGKRKRRRRRPHREVAGTEGTSKKHDHGPPGAIYGSGSHPEEQSIGLEVEQVRRWRAEIESLADEPDALASPELRAARASTRRKLVDDMVLVALSSLAYVSLQIDAQLNNREWTGHQDVDGLLRASFGSSFPNRSDKQIERQKGDALFVLIESYDSAGLAMEQVRVLLGAELALRQGMRLSLAARVESDSTPEISETRAQALQSWSAQTLSELEYFVGVDGTGRNTKHLEHTVQRGVGWFKIGMASSMRNLSTPRALATIRHWSEFCRVTGHAHLATWEQIDG